jgi:hypothetical protein
MKRLIIILLTLALNGCDLFTTRTPEPPTAPATNSVPATTPDILLSNFQNAVNQKMFDNYFSCLVDSAFLKKRFKFTASAGSSSQYPALTNWNLESEKQYFRNQNTISSAGNSVNLTVSNQLNTQLGDSALYQFDYSLSLLASDQSISGTYQGTVQFKIFLDSRNQWVIVQWDDSRKNNSASWSDLKGRLY